MNLQPPGYALVNCVAFRARRLILTLLTGASLLAGSLSFALDIPAGGSIAIIDVTLIDGTGNPATSNTTVLVEDGRISRIGAAGSFPIPAGTRTLDGRGGYLLPGMIDSNVHASIYGNSNRRETVVKYGDRNAELVLEFAQRQLKHGITTVRDSYGSLLPLIETRDRIARGDAVGARLLVAGNIIGWGGPFSMTFSLMRESELTLFQERWNDSIAQGVGEELMDMGPEEVRAAIDAYLDKGVDFLKYGGTSHFSFPSLIGFSPRIQRVIVEQAHARGLIAETHATSPEGLRLAVEAGIDLIQHPEILSAPIPDDLLELIIERDVLCAIRANTLTGEPWQEYLAGRVAEEARQATLPAAATSAERRRRAAALRLNYAIERDNAIRLIKAGCTVTIATDNYQGRAPEFRREPKSPVYDAGVGSILAIEGLVELGMTPMQALVAATRNGARAAGMLSQIGTIEANKVADLVLLSADPLDDIRNIRQLRTVVVNGYEVDVKRLPEERLFFTGDETF